MFNIFKNEETEKENNHPSIIAVACLLIHSARIDQNYTEKENKIIISRDRSGEKPLYFNISNNFLLRH